MGAPRDDCNKCYHLSSHNNDCSSDKWDLNAETCPGFLDFETEYAKHELQYEIEAAINLLSCNGYLVIKG